MSEGAIRVQVSVDDVGRVDKALARHFPDAGRKQLAELFDDGVVRVRGKRAKKGDRVEAGDVIELTRAPITPSERRPQPDAALAERLVVLVERADLVAVDKPAGVPSQPLRAGELGTIANAIVARWPECAAVGGPADDVRDGGLVHRLDIGTSGVLIAARTAEAYRALRDAFSAGRVAKHYVALCDARPVSRESDAPLAQRGNHVVVDHTDGLAANTSFVVERETATHSLVRCEAHTGRMHQVRAHLALVGAPIAGDRRYGGHPIADHDGFFLHAARAVLPGPPELTIDSPLPARFTAALAAVGLAPS